QACDFANPQTGPIGGRQRRSVTQSGDRFEKAHDLVGTQHHWQLLRLAPGDDALERLALAQRDAVEKPQRTSDLVNVRPRSLLRDQMKLVGAHVLQTKPIRRTVEMPAKLRDRVDVGLLR